MLALVELLDINYLISTAAGFLAGSIINYYLSVKYVFIAGRYKKVETELLIFMAFTLLGLVLNHFVMYSGCEWMNIDYKIVKIISLIIVTIFNYLTKKIFVFKK